MIFISLSLTQVSLSVSPRERASTTHVIVSITIKADDRLPCVVVSRVLVACRVSTVAVLGLLAGAGSFIIVCTYGPMDKLLPLLAPLYCPLGL